MSASAPISDAWLSSLHARLLAHPERGVELGSVLGLLARALVELGLAPGRVSLSVITHQPGLSGIGWAWRQSDGVVSSFERPWGFLDTDEHRTSPVHAVITSGQPLFLDAAAIVEDRRFPLVRSFAEAGATSYFALPVRTSRGDVHVLAAWTARDGGWSAQELEEARRVVPLLSLLLEVSESRRLLRLFGSAAERSEEARVSAQAVAEEKVRFLALMSHEIRTPLHGVLGVGELLARTPLDGEQRRHADTLLKAGRGLLALLDTILDFSKLEEGRFDLERIPTAPAILAEEVLELLRPGAVERELELALSVSPSVPALILGDPTRLRQVLLNLVGNAVKFTRRGSVTITLETITAEASAPLLRCSVRDTGAGIPDEAQSRLFKPFTQAEDSTARRYGGTGLGLAVSRRIIEQMGGSIGFESRIGRGSTFTFTIPLEAASALAPAGPPPAEDGGASLSALRVLVVDDNPVNRSIAQRQLDVLGVAERSLVGDGLAALEHLATGKYDVVLMDVQMPELDGLEATRRLRRLALAPRPWVVAMTANAFDEDRRACAEAGMDDFLSKPFSLDALRAALKRAQRVPTSPTSPTGEGGFGLGPGG